MIEDLRDVRQRAGECLDVGLYCRELLFSREGTLLVKGTGKELEQRVREVVVTRGRKEELGGRNQRYRKVLRPVSTLTLSST